MTVHLREWLLRVVSIICNRLPSSEIAGGQGADFVIENTCYD